LGIRPERREDDKQRERGREREKDKETLEGVPSHVLWP
jgi:hypothetical protein